MKFNIFALGLAALATVSALPAAEPELTERQDRLTCKSGCSVVSTQAYRYYCQSGVSGRAIITTTERKFADCVQNCSGSGIYCTAASWNRNTKQCTVYSSGSTPVKVAGNWLAVAVNSC